MTTTTIQNLIATAPIWVNDSEELARLCEHWQQQGAIAVDTEFMRTTTFYPKLALLQVGDGEGCYLIDPLVIDDFSSFKALMVNANVTKVMHSCSEDIEVFKAFFDLVPKPLFDTQVAAAIAGYDFSMGYAKLIATMFHVDVPKSETRSDWMQRPLSQSQLQYAALDVAYLIVAYGRLLTQLKAQNRLQWVIEDCANTIEAAMADEDYESFYLKIKLAWKLNRSQLSSLQLLAAWREYHARDFDVPRNRLIKEGALWEMARTQPTTAQQLKKIEGLPARVIHENGNTLLDIVQEGKNVPANMQPQLVPKPLSPAAGDLLKHLKKVSRETAESLSLPVEVLVRKKDYEAIIRSKVDNGDYQISPRLKGWRESIIGEKLLAAANAWRA